MRGARDTPSREGRACLSALAALARGGGAAAAEAVATDAASLRCLIDALAASDVATRSEASPPFPVLTGQVSPLPSY